LFLTIYISTLFLTIFLSCHVIYTLNLGCSRRQLRLPVKICRKIRMFLLLPVDLRQEHEKICVEVHYTFTFTSKRLGNFRQHHLFIRVWNECFVMLAIVFQWKNSPLLLLLGFIVFLGPAAVVIWDNFVVGFRFQSMFGSAVESAFDQILKCFFFC